MVVVAGKSRKTWVTESWMSVPGLLITMIIGPAAYDSFAFPFPVIPYFTPYMLCTAGMAVLVKRMWRYGHRGRAVAVTLVVLLTLATAYDNWYTRQLQPNGQVKVSDIRWW